MAHAAQGSGIRDQVCVGRRPDHLRFGVLVCRCLFVGACLLVLVCRCLFVGACVLVLTVKVHYHRGLMKRRRLMSAAVGPPSHTHWSRACATMPHSLCNHASGCVAVCVCAGGGAAGASLGTGRHTGVTGA